MFPDFQPHPRFRVFRPQQEPIVITTNHSGKIQIQTRRLINNSTHVAPVDPIIRGLSKPFNTKTLKYVYLLRPQKTKSGQCRDNPAGRPPGLLGAKTDVSSSSAAASSSLSRAPASVSPALVTSTSPGQPGDPDTGAEVTGPGPGKGKRGRPRKHAPKLPLPPLYVFIRNLLHNPGYNPSVIAWVDHTGGCFKVRHD